MKNLLIFLLIAWIVISVIGFVVEALLWLAFIGLILFVVTALYWWWRAKRSKGASKQ